MIFCTPGYYKIEIPCHSRLSSYRVSFIFIFPCICSFNINWDKDLKIEQIELNPFKISKMYRFFYFPLYFFFQMNVYQPLIRPFSLFFFNSKPNTADLLALVSMSYSLLSLTQNELILPIIWSVYKARKIRTIHISRTFWDH